MRPSIGITGEYAGSTINLSLSHFNTMVRTEFQDVMTQDVDYNEELTPLIIGQTTAFRVQWSGQATISGDDWLSWQELMDMQRIALRAQSNWGLIISDNRELIAERIQTRPEVNGTSVLNSPTGGKRYYPMCQGIITSLRRVDERGVAPNTRKIELTIVETDKLPVN